MCVKASAAGRLGYCKSLLGRTPWNKGKPAPHDGIPRSAETRERIRQGILRHAALDLPDCRCGHHNQDPETLGLGRGSTALALAMVEVFLTEFPEVIMEKSFGRYRVDAYLPPPYHLAFEADGAYWHERRGQDYDARRDTYLFEWFGLSVVRLTEAEIGWARRRRFPTK